MVLLHFSDGTFSSCYSTSYRHQKHCVNVLFIEVEWQFFEKPIYKSYKVATIKMIRTITNMELI